MNSKLKTGDIVQSNNACRFFKLIRNKGKNKFYCNIRIMSGGTYEGYEDFSTYNDLKLMDEFDKKIQREIALQTLNYFN